MRRAATQVVNLFEVAHKGLVEGVEGGLEEGECLMEAHAANLIRKPFTEFVVAAQEEP